MEEASQQGHVKEVAEWCEKFEHCMYMSVKHRRERRKRRRGEEEEEEERRRREEVNGETGRELKGLINV